MVFDGYGHLGVGLSLSGRVLRRYVHRLVAEAFLENPEGKPEVAHVNGRPEDNRVSNVRWSTRFENMRDMVQHGNSNSGIKNPSARLTAEQATEIRDRYIPRVVTMQQLANEYGISKSSVQQIVEGKGWISVLVSSE